MTRFFACTLLVTKPKEAWFWFVSCLSCVEQFTVSLSVSWQNDCSMSHSTVWLPSEQDDSLNIHSFSTQNHVSYYLTHVMIFCVNMKQNVTVSYNYALELFFMTSWTFKKLLSQINHPSLGNIRIIWHIILNFMCWVALSSSEASQTSFV